VLLAIATLAMLAAALVKAGDRRFTLAFMSAVLGLFYLFEYVLVCLLDAYRYHPMLTPHDAFQDTVLGNIFSQSSIAVACALSIVYRLKPVWYFIFAATYYLVELLFIRLGVFELHWYRAIYTPLVMVPLFWVMKQWYERAYASRDGAGGNALLFLGTLSLAGNTVYLPFKLTRVHVFTGGFFADMSRDHTTTLILYAFIFIGPLVFIYRSGLRRQWKALLAAALYMMQYAALKAGLMTFRAGWFIPATVLEICISYFWISLLGRLVRTRRPSANRA
jgi:hypothetical protein